MPLASGHLQGIAILVLRAHDRERLAAFYSALGFEEAARSERIVGMWAGPNAVLEIGRLDEGTPMKTPVFSRTQAAQCTIFESSDVPAVVAAAREAGASFVEEWAEGNGGLFYIGDPEGNVVGFISRNPARSRPER